MQTMDDSYWCLEYRLFFSGRDTRAKRKVNTAKCSATAREN